MNIEKLKKYVQNLAKIEYDPVIPTEDLYSLIVRLIEFTLEYNELVKALESEYTDDENISSKGSLQTYLESVLPINLNLESKAILKSLRPLLEVKKTTEDLSKVFLLLSDKNNTTLPLDQFNIRETIDNIKDIKSDSIEIDIKVREKLFYLKQIYNFDVSDQKIIELSTNVISQMNQSEDGNYWGKENYIRSIEAAFLNTSVSSIKRLKGFKAIDKNSPFYPKFDEESFIELENLPKETRHGDFFDNLCYWFGESVGGLKSDYKIKILLRFKDEIDNLIKKYQVNNN